MTHDPDNERDIFGNEHDDDFAHEVKSHLGLLALLVVVVVITAILFSLRWLTA